MRSSVVDRPTDDASSVGVDSHDGQRIALLAVICHVEDKSRDLGVWGKGIPCMEVCK